MQTLKKALLLMFAVASSGCAVFDPSIENLITPPPLTDVQYNVDSSLRNSVGEDIKLKYPQNGEYKSAYNFLDLDGDGIDEAVALFSNPNEESIRLAILKQTNDTWSVTDILPGEIYYNTADFLSYQTIGHSQYLIVGWSSNSMSNEILMIYKYQKDSSNNFTLNAQSRWEYNDLTIADFDGDGFDELMLLALADNYSTTEPYIQILDEVEEGVLQSASLVYLAKNIVDFKNIMIGQIDTNLYGMLIDCLLTNNYMSTVAITYVNGELYTPFEIAPDDQDINDELYRQTFRKNPVFCEDVNGDGVLDIPLETFAVGYESKDVTPVYFTEYANLHGSEFVPFLSSYVNLSKNYRFNFPAVWSELPVSATVQLDNTDVIFFALVNDDIHDFSHELVRISAYSNIDGTDKIDKSRYFDLGQKGTTLYSASLPTTQTEPFMSENDVRNHFVLID